MPANIDVIRVAETHVAQLYQQMRDLVDEALADDGIVDAEEQAEIDRVRTKIDDLQGLVTERRRIWETNKSAYEGLRPNIDAGLGQVNGCTDPDLAGDQRTITDLAGQVDQCVSAEDYGGALDFTPRLQDLIARFVSLMEQIAENARLADMTDEELAAESLTAIDPTAIFEENYMLDLVHADYPGEGNSTLKDLMRMLEDGTFKDDREANIAALADIVGRPPSESELDGDFDRFLVLKRQQAQIGDQNNSGDVPDLDEETHENFRASRGQLMFGRALGEVFDIHEVFAAQLSPTGGLVGPGNSAFHLAPDNPVALHGAVHDAAGYMKAYHNEGPGYNYREDSIEGAITSAIELLPADVQATLLPLTGQVSGIAFWTMEVGDEYAMRVIEDALVAVERGLGAARDLAADKIAEAMGFLQDKADEFSDAADALRDEIEESVDEFVDDVSDAVDAVEQGLRDAADATEEFVEDAVDDLRRGLNDAADTAEDLAREAMDDVREGLSDMAEAAEELVEEAAEGIQRGLDHAADTAEAVVAGVSEAVGEAMDAAQDAAVEVVEGAYEVAGAISDAAGDAVDAIANFFWG